MGSLVFGAIWAGKATHTLAEYLKHAEEYRRLAELMTAPADKKVLVELAQAWDRLLPCAKRILRRTISKSLPSQNFESGRAHRPRKAACGALCRRYAPTVGLRQKQRHCRPSVRQPNGLLSKKTASYGGQGKGAAFRVGAFAVSEAAFLRWPSLREESKCSELRLRHDISRPGEISSSYGQTGANFRLDSCRSGLFLWRTRIR
jgi:hypothetical protein